MIKNLKKLNRRGTAAAFILMLSVSMATGCVPTTGTAVERGPNFEVVEGLPLDETQLYNDTLEAFGGVDENPYSYIAEFDIAVDNDAKLITVTASSINGVTEADAEQFAAAAVRHIADAAVTQSSEYVLSSQTGFGTLWNTYALKLSIIPLSANGDESEALLNLDIAAGEDIPLNPDIETYEEEWVEGRDEALAGIVYDTNGNIVSQ